MINAVLVLAYMYTAHTTEVRVCSETVVKPRVQQLTFAQMLSKIWRLLILYLISQRFDSKALLYSSLRIT